MPKVFQTWFEKNKNLFKASLLGNSKEELKCWGFMNLSGKQLQHNETLERARDQGPPSSACNSWDLAGSRGICINRGRSTTRDEGKPPPPPSLLLANRPTWSVSCWQVSLPPNQQSSSSAIWLVSQSCQPTHPRHLNLKCCLTFSTFSPLKL